MSTPSPGPTAEDTPQAPSHPLVRWLHRWRVPLGALVGGLLHLAAEIVATSGGARA